MFLLLLLLVPGLATPKQPPPKYTPPVCFKSSCETRHINVMIYLDDDMWHNMTGNWGDNPKQLILFQIKKTFEEANKLLAELDNGGYKLVFDQNDVVKLSDSEVLLGDKYIDGINSNLTKELDTHEIFSHTFAFQQAVEKLSNRNAKDLRMLIRKYNKNDSVNVLAEENCICNYNSFGCVASFSIKNSLRWWAQKNELVHGIGHTLGYKEAHDDEFYSGKISDKLLMSKNVRKEATLWSPMAKEMINAHNNSCLQTESIKKDRNSTKGSKLPSSALVSASAGLRWSLFLI